MFYMRKRSSLIKSTKPDQSKESVLQTVFYLYYSTLIMVNVLDKGDNSECCSFVAKLDNIITL